MRNYNDYIPPTEGMLQRTPSGARRLRLTTRGRIVTATVVFATAGAGSVAGAAFVINAQQHQLEKSNRIVAQLAPATEATPSTTFGTPTTAPTVRSVLTLPAPVRTIKAPTVTRTVTRTVTVTRKVPVTKTKTVTRTMSLKKLLPYYNEEAPAWCLEDMACWIGSKADGRTDAQILTSLKCDLLGSSYDYSNTDAGYDPADFKEC